MEVRQIKIDEVPSAPFSGMGTVIVLEQSETMVRLLYPVTLQEFTMPIKDTYNQKGTLEREGYVQSTEDHDQLWPINKTPYVFTAEKLVAILRKEVQRRYLYRESVPRRTVEGIIAELLAVSAESVREDLDQLEASTKPVDRPKQKRLEQLKITQEDNTVAKKKKEPKASGHRGNILYLATTKLDPEKFKGQKQLVAKALGAYSTPKSLEDVVRKVESNGGYKVKATGGLTDSVHFHLRELVKDGKVKEEKTEKETLKPELVGASA